MVAEGVSEGSSAVANGEAGGKVSVAGTGTAGDAVTVEEGAGEQADRRSMTTSPAMEILKWRLLRRRPKSVMNIDLPPGIVGSFSKYIAMSRCRIWKT
jgi:hypothetical protein